MNDFIKSMLKLRLVEYVIENDASVEETFYKMKETHNLLIKDLDNVRNKQCINYPKGENYIIISIADMGKN